ncbi:MAG: hypothetical protein QFB87_02915 [Patescibacteria group bacterium]|nr:hypothetical protein [Patescibacteria group bacterium]
MKRPVFYRSVDARDNLELFLVSAVSSLLLVRFYLYLTGYPQVGSGSLHIAHVLFGGLFMLAAIVIGLSFLGRRTQRLVAILGGIGFGVFIDELGKFVTRDNNYFFRPTIGIIYAIFISLYLLFNFISKASKLTSIEYQLNAMLQLEEAVREDLDPREKRHIKQLLAKADQSSIITQELQALLARLETVPAPTPRIIRKFVSKLDRGYRHFWQRRNSSQLIGVLFIVEAFIFLLVVLASIVNNFDTVRDFLKGNNSYGQELIIGQLVSSAFVAGYAIVGAVRLRSSRAEAFEQFRRATLVNLFLTEFFIFSRIQFGAIPSFLVNLVLLIALRYALHQENHGRLSS